MVNVSKEMIDLLNEYPEGIEAHHLIDLYDIDETFVIAKHGNSMILAVYNESDKLLKEDDFNNISNEDLESHCLDVFGGFFNKFKDYNEYTQRFKLFKSYIIRREDEKFVNYVEKISFSSLSSLEG